MATLLVCLRPGIYIYIYIYIGDLKTPLLVLPVFFLSGSTYNTGMRQSNADEQVIDRCGVGDTCRHELIFQFGTPQPTAHGKLLFDQLHYCNLPQHVFCRARSIVTGFPG